MTLSREVIVAERLRRQRFLEPVKTHADYLALFSLLQPVSPPYFSYPGSPPSMTHRAVSDMELAERFRERRELVKGRFLSKTIGYVLADDLELYANAFCRPLGKMMTLMQRRVYDALATAGPLTPRQISEETDLLNKEVMPALHRLQEAFLVYEDQLTTDWERGWYLFGSEWPEITVEKERWEQTGSEVLLRFLAGHVFATTRQMKDWSGWAVKDVNRLLADLEAREAVVRITISGLGEGWLRPAHANLPAEPVAPTVFMLHRADPLVRSHASELRERYRGLEVLQYLLIDGAFRGAVCGHWRIGPHDVEDIIIDLSHAQRASRKAEIIQAVAWKYYPPSHRILRYAGKPMERGY